MIDERREPVTAVTAAEEITALRAKAEAACLEEVNAVLLKYGMNLQVIQNIAIRPR